MSNKKAVILFSGGLDTVTCLAMAKAEGYACYALSFDYGQKHRSELIAAKKLAQQMGVVEHRILQLPTGYITGSALTDADLAVPENTIPKGITTTYVPARNVIFLSFALSWAEVIGAHDIFYGANAPDNDGFPDCRPAFISAFEIMANQATKAGVEGQPFRLHAPLVALQKADIIKRGMALGIDYAATVTCYQADDQGRACGHCDSCRTRMQGFEAAGISDPTRYINA